MTQHDDFFQQKQPAAVLKHALLREYAKVFASAVGSRNRSRPVWVIDGYAGAGAYEEPDPEGRHPDGSPLVLLKMAEPFAKTQVINSIFIEAEPAEAAALEQNTRGFRDRGMVVSVLQGDVEQRLPEAWALVGQDPVVTFLDPFGVAMSMATMTGTLLGRNPREAASEVLLNINLEAVWRIGGNLETGPGGVGPRPGQEKGIERLDVFLGGTWWRSSFHDMRREQNRAASAAAAHVIEQYRARIKQTTGYDSIAIPIRRRPHHEPLFLLTLFFRHAFAGYKFADAACRATKRWRDTYRAREMADFLGADESLFGSEFDMAFAAEHARRQEAELDRAWTETIAANIRALGSPRLDVARNIGPILGDTLGLAGERHLRLAWDDLSQQGYLMPRNKSQRIERAAMVRA